MCLVSKGCNEVNEPMEKGVCLFKSFELNAEDACSLPAAKVQASSYIQRNNRILHTTSVGLSVDFCFSFESNEHLCCQTKPKCHCNNLPCH